jgi:hypothetical protein
MRNTVTTSFIIGYEPEFHVAAIAPVTPDKKRRKR